jgi:hypothetical protein
LTTVKRPANSDAIQMFYTSPEMQLPGNEQFNLAEFSPSFDEEARLDLENQIHTMMDKCSFSDNEVQSWKLFLQAIPLKVTDVLGVEDFCLPLPQTSEYVRHKAIPLPLDTGIRAVDVVTHRAFPEAARQKAVRTQQRENPCLQCLKKGDFVVLQMTVSNCASYPFDFVIAQVIEDVSNKDTTKADTEIHFQMFRPSTIDNIESKMVPWIGDDNKLWRGHFERGHVKALVQLQSKGKKLTADSRKMIKDAFF